MLHPKTTCFYYYRKMMMNLNLNIIVASGIKTSLVAVPVSLSVLYSEHGRPASLRSLSRSLYCTRSTGDPRHCGPYLTVCSVLGAQVTCVATVPVSLV